MTIANQCPDCGRTDPIDETDAYVDDDGPITYICESWTFFERPLSETTSRSEVVKDFYCACGAQVGGFAHPQV